MRSFSLSALVLLALTLPGCGKPWGFGPGRIGNIEAIRTSKEDCEARRCQWSPDEGLCLCPVGANDASIRPQPMVRPPQ